MKTKLSSDRQRRRAATVLVLMAALLIAPEALALGISFGWARNMGGTSNENGRAIALDGSGNVYTTGSFEGTADFDPGPGIFNLTSAGGWETFISKLDGNGNFIWAKRMGGANANVAAQAIAVDGAGNVYITGYFEGTADFDPGVGAYNLTSIGGSVDIFVGKLDSNGSLLWAKSMGGESNDYVSDIALDESGNVYTTGNFSGTADFDPEPGVNHLFLQISAGGTDIFINKLSNSGDFVWARSMGGTGGDEGHGIALDGSGNVYTTGNFLGTADFDPDLDTTVNLASAGNTDIFISKLSSSGDFIWAKRMGGTSGDYSYDIALDISGNVYTTGDFQGLADFDPDPGITTNLTSAGRTDIFISKLDSSGIFIWARSMGGTSDEPGLDIALDGSGNVYTTGYFWGTADFDPGPGITTLTSAGGPDIFVSKLDSSGSFVCAKRMGVTVEDVGYAIALDGSGNVYTTGYFMGTADFDPGAGTTNLASAGGRDIFISKLVDEKSTTLRSQAKFDGWVLESTETSKKGGTKNNSSKVFYVGDDELNRQYRGFLSFDTSALPDTAVVTKVTLMVKQAGLVGTNPYRSHKGLYVDIQNPYFGSRPTLQLSDFQKGASLNMVGKFPKKPVLKWYTVVLNSAANPYINTTGLTQFRLRYKLDDNNDFGADYLMLYSGNAPVSSRPQLIVEYYVP